MNNLIKIQEKDGQQLVSARDLYSFLGLSERFSAWIERNLKYGSKEGRDFTGVGTSTTVNNGAKILLQDYALTLDTAKQLAMLSRSDKGVQVREYFIECEKKLREVQAAPALPQDYDEALEALLLARKAKKLAELEAEKQKALAQELAPHASYACEVLDSSSSYTATQMAKELNMKSAEALNTKLAEMRVHFLSGDIWVLYAKYSDKGYQKRGQKTITGRDGRKWQIAVPKWNEKGREFLHSLFNTNYSKALKPIDE